MNHIVLNNDQLDDLNSLLNAAVTRGVADAASLKRFTNDFAQEQAEECLSGAAKASALIALLLEQCG